jgi:hypothetical protein
MSEPIHDQDAVNRHRRDESAPTPDVDATNEEQGRPCPAPVKPGYRAADAAYRSGCEDEHIDRMNARYGGEW